MLPAWVYSLIACSVTAVWVLANVIALVQTGAVADESVHLVMGTVAGATFAGGTAKRRAEERDE